MSTHESVYGGDEERRQFALRFGMWSFLGTVTMLFAAFTSAYIVRQAGGDFERITLPGVLWFSTTMLLLSSVALEIGRREQRRRAWGAAGSMLVTTAVLGAAFLLGQVGAWRELVARGVYLPDNPYSSFFYIFTGLHAIHLVAALAFVLWVAFRVARSGAAMAGERSAGLVDRAAAFWHFLGGLWIYLFIVLAFF